MSNSYRVTVTQLVPAESRSANDPRPPNPTEINVFSQTFVDAEFDMQSFVLAINKKKRVRKARAGKEAAT